MLSCFVFVVEGASMKTNIFSKIGQVGVIVKDVDKTVSYLYSLGIGPFMDLPGRPFGDRKKYGKPCDYKLKIKVAQMGPVQIELIQPLEGESIQKEFLENKGGGIHHIGFFVKDINKKVAELGRKEIKVIQSGSGPTMGGFAYLDTELACGIVLELIEWDIG